MKYIIGFLITVCLLCTSVYQPVAASSRMPEELRQQIIEAESKGVKLGHPNTKNTLTASTEAILSIDGSKAIANITVIGLTPDVTTIMVFVYLERKKGDSWEQVASWNHTDQSYFLTYTTPATYVPLKSTYRVRVSSYVYTRTKYENMEFYSSVESN